MTHISYARQQGRQLEEDGQVLNSTEKKEEIDLLCGIGTARLLFFHHFAALTGNVCHAMTLIIKKNYLMRM